MSFNKVVRTCLNFIIIIISYVRIPSVILIKDALNMLHLLTEGGMTVALSDVVLLRNLLKPLHHLNEASSCIESFYTLRKVYSTFVVWTYLDLVCP